jgi:peptidoglycan hydrolase CwlO-like protein
MVLTKTRQKIRKEDHIHIHRRYNLFTKTGAVLCLVLFIFSPYPIYAATEEEQLASLNKQIQEAQSQLSAIRSQKAGLQSELAAFDLQINTIQMQINATQSEINIINRQIAETNAQIAKAEQELSVQKDIMKEYIRTMYIEGQTSTLELIAESENFSDFVDRSEYLNTMQEKVQETANKIVDLKDKLEEEKKQQEAKKLKSETLKGRQVAQRSALDNQRNGKQYLLNETAGSEANYKSYLSRLQKEMEKVQAAIWARAGGGYVSLGHVNRGQVIGYIGNTGFSSGCHLHFEIRTSPTTHVNPAGYLGNGYFINPVPGVAMNVPYGYSAAYFDGWFHTGQDYADGCAGTPIKSSAEGEIITRVTGQGNTYPGGPPTYGNYVMIRHTNGMYSLYGHMR